MSQEQQRFTVKEAIGYVAASCLIIWGIFFGICFICQKVQERRIGDEKFNIVALYQKSSTTDTVPSVYLEELLGLSCDMPTNVYAFSCKKAEKKLKSLPLFQRVKVKVAKPGVVFVDYELRKPVARIADFENMGISEDKYLFPLAPFISPKNIPDIVLGQVDDKRVDFAFEILKLGQKTCPTSCVISRLDLSSAFIEKANREIILTIDEGSPNLTTHSYLVRLPFKSYEDSLTIFFKLKSAFISLQEKSEAKQFVVDLRLANIALVKKVDNQ